ncbi:MULTISPECIES: hypothetical protein [Mesotoga]|jgi:hypothetical protein|uniref:hypothetical protein n=1 Tax=Mesotoga TaxID=1184396 RepID=UPI0002CAE03C|nr:hypothetical protein [Mesotoga sp. BH458_6_3_2_1]CCU85340.1 hypothetical protein PHOSAC3_150340 [Mesotoga infera]
MPALGRIERVDDLRRIWQHETHDFSKWLAQEENLVLLSDAIGIDIVFEELESPVGGFNVDLYGTVKTEQVGKSLLRTSWKKQTMTT